MSENSAMPNPMNRVSPCLALSLLFPNACSACATIAFDPVRTTDESALIVWNSKTHVEQFVRRATFESKAKNFGFLVPTSSRPTLGAADDAIFESLQRELEPKTVVQRRRGIDFALFVASRSSGSREEKSGQGESPTSIHIATGVTNSGKAVEVVEQKRVGDYNAVVLRARDTKSLSRWLKRHHYPVSPDA